jgi:two-component system cell cycle response regulator CpdR
LASILLAEDDKAVREFVSRALRQDGHDVTAVSDGQQALNVLNTGKFDMMLADIVMPQVDGIALALKASKDYPDLPVLLMTGYSAERQRLRRYFKAVHAQENLRNGAPRSRSCKWRIDSPLNAVSLSRYQNR